MYYDGHPNAQFMQPSKVIHVRNLPFEIADEEIAALCSEFGQVVAVKGRVGEKKNQAFVELADLAAAKSIVNRYQNNADPARLRGRAVFLSFAGRDFLKNATSTFSAPSPVLAVQFSEISESTAPLLTIEAVYAALSVFGTVVKVALSPAATPPAGSRLVFAQFVDLPSAQRAKQEMPGARMPQTAFEAAGVAAPRGQPPPLVASARFCAQRNLVVPAQSALLRDFTRPELAWGEPSLEYLASLAPPPGAGAATRVLSVTFERAAHPVTLEGLHTICGTYGAVQRIHTYDREGRAVALVQYAEPREAETARAALEGHAMYGDGNNVMRLVFSRHNDLVIRPGDPRSRDFTAAGAAVAAQGQAAPGGGQAAPGGGPSAAAVQAGPQNGWVAHPPPQQQHQYSIPLYQAQYTGPRGPYAPFGAPGYWAPPAAAYAYPGPVPHGMYYPGALPQPQGAPYYHR